MQLPISNKKNIFNFWFFSFLCISLGILLLAGCLRGIPDDPDEDPRTSPIMPTNIQISPIPNAFEE